MLDVMARVAGFRELDAALKQLPKAVEGRVLTTAARAGANVLKEEIKSRAPVRGADGKPIKRGSRATKPGYLRAAAALTKLKTGKGTAASYDVGFLRSAFWIRFLEMGTAHMAAHPFMRSAFDAADERSVDRVRNVLATSITKAAQRLAVKRLSGRR